MDAVKLLEWLVENGNKLTAFSLVAIDLVVVTVGLYKRWWVPGWMFKNCEADRDKWRGMVDSEAERVRIRLDALEDQPRRRASR